MAQYSTDFSEYTTGVQPSDWTERWHTDGSWVIVDDAGATGGKVLRHTAGTSSRRALSWDAIDSDANRDNAEVLLLSRYETTADFANQLRVLLRGSGTSTSENGYIIGHYGSDTQRFQRSAKYVSATYTELGTATVIATSPGVFFWQRVRINGTQISRKVWTGTIDDEPGTWDEQNTDGDISGVGWVGLFCFDPSSGNMDYDYLSVGTNGDTAPSPTTDSVVATASADVTSGDATLAVQFTGSQTGGTGPFTYSWAFGDGNTSTAQSPLHSYTSTGLYTATLTVTDTSDSSTSQDSVIITVTDPGISLSEDFDRGSMDISNSSVLPVDSSGTQEVTLHPRDVAGKWWAFICQINGMNGQQPKIKVGNLANRHFVALETAAANGWRPCWTTTPDDRNSWNYMDTAPTKVGSYVEWAFPTAFNSATVYVSYAPVVRNSWVPTWIASLSNISELPSSTAFGGAAYQFDATNATKDELGRAIASQPMYGFKVGTGSVKVILISGHHAGEDHGNLVMLEAVEFLTGSDPVAVSLRADFTFLCYPLINVTGRTGGHYRSTYDDANNDGNPDGVSIDPNRDWNDAEFVLECTQKTKDATLTDLEGSTPAVVLDFHGEMDTEPSWFYNNPRSATEDAFKTAVDTYMSIATAWEGTFITDTAHWWYDQNFGGIDISLIPEFGDQFGANTITRAAEFGEAQMKAIADAVTVPNIAPVASFTVDNSSPTTGQTVTATDTSTDADSDPLTLSWQLTSIPVGSSVTPLSGSGSTFQFTPDVAGDYTLQLTADDGTTTDSAQQVITASEPIVSEIIGNARIGIGFKIGL